MFVWNSCCNTVAVGRLCYSKGRFYGWNYSLSEKKNECKRFHYKFRFLYFYFYINKSFLEMFECNSNRAFMLQ